MNTKRVLITGGAGSLGRELVLCLSRLGHRVCAFDLPVCDFSPLESLTAVEILKGDIRDADKVRRAVEGIDVAVHLAALLPPASERDRDGTLAVNVGGTENIMRALESENPDAHVILASSVCVYGDTTGKEPPILVSHPLRAMDYYAESKIAAERVVLGGELPYTILRISGISVPALLEPPMPWPFMEGQRIEFVCRTDVVEALAASVDVPEAVGRMFHVAGGTTWRMTGGEYVARFSGIMGLSAEEAEYMSQPGYFGWYDTAESQAALGYQRTSFPRFLELLELVFEEALGGLE